MNCPRISLLHLVICFLEYAALIELLGTVRARAALERRHVYTGIYAVVMQDYGRIHEIAARYDALP